MNGVISLKKKLLDALVINQNELLFIKISLKIKTIFELEQIVNLVFGLEIRIEDAKQVAEIPYNFSMLRRRLEDARDLKDRHGHSLLTVERIVKDRLGDSTQIRFREIKRLSETNICNRKMVVHELYICHLQFKLINLFG